MKIKTSIALFALLVTPMLHSATVSPGDPTKKDDAIVSWTPNAENKYTVSASASGAPFVVSTITANNATVDPNPSTGSASASASLTFKDAPATDKFPISITGLFGGAGKGLPIRWTVTRQQEFYWLEPFIKIIPEGVTFSVSGNGMTPTSTQWSISSASGGTASHTNSASSIDFKTLWEKLNITVPSGKTAPLTGEYAISAASTNENPNRTASSGSTVYVIKVTANVTDLFGPVEKNGDGSNKTAYVHWNIDNDNGTTLTQSGQHPDADYLKTTTAVIGENDLKPFNFTMSPVINRGSIEIFIGSSGKIWKSATKGASSGTNSQLLLAGGTTKTWDLSNAAQRSEFINLGTLYMEGVGGENATFTVKYKDDDGAVITSDSISYSFIAANCGNQPIITWGDQYETAFPNLVRCEWSFTGEFSNIYNCIAYSIGETNRHYSKEDMDAAGNNNGVFESSDVIDFYKSNGYELTTENQSTVMYYSNYHGAKKKSCSCGSGQWNMWESKAGMASHVLEHRKDQLDGSNYGTPILYFKKR